MAVKGAEPRLATQVPQRAVDPLWSQDAIS